MLPPKQGSGSQGFNFMRRIILIGVLLVAAVAAGGYWWMSRQGGAPGGGEHAAGGDSGAAGGGFALPVEAAPVEVGRIELTIPAVGSLRSNESVVIAPEIAGRLAEVLVAEGDKVAAGTTIARLDQSVYRAQLQQAQANLELSRADVERYQKMRAGEVASEQTMQRAEAALRTNLADIAVAQANLAKTELKAPFDGVLGLRRVSVGDYLDAGDAIINLEQVDPLKVDFRVPEVYFTTVKIGQIINITVDALPGETFQGTIYAIDPLIDAAGRSIVLRARVPNPDDKLRPGLFARVSLVYAVHDQALLIPEQAVVPFGDQKFVFRVVDGKAAQTAVELGEYVAGKVEVLKGLAAGDIVITAGQLKIANGMPVTPIAPGGAGGGATEGTGTGGTGTGGAETGATEAAAPAGG
jgi:membrane fusion protein (multidrug efflux system)